MGQTAGYQIILTFTKFATPAKRSFKSRIRTYFSKLTFLQIKATMFFCYSMANPDP